MGKGGRHIKVLVASVPHSGTIFTSDLLLTHWAIKKKISVDARVATIDDTKEYDLMQGHYGFDRDDIIEQLCQQMPYVVPLRDPLLTLISHKTRHSGRDNTWTIRCWKVLNERFRKYRPLYLPVDILSTMDRELRLSWMNSFLADVGINQMGEETFDYISKWEIKNTFGDSELRDAYNSGDMNKIIKLMPEEVDALLGYRDDLKSLLAEAGYDNLIWY